MARHSGPVLVDTNVILEAYRVDAWRALTGQGQSSLRHPGALIRIEALEELGLTVSAAARILGVRRATLSDLLNGNASLSPEMALRVEKAFGLSMDQLLRMQAWHDVAQMRARAGEIDVRRHQPA